VGELGSEPALPHLLRHPLSSSATRIAKYAAQTSADLVPVFHDHRCLELAHGRVLALSACRDNVIRVPSRRYTMRPLKTVSWHPMSFKRSMLAV
jgi:hypothetical protein